MKARALKIFAVLIGLTLISTVCLQASAAVVWSDNFDDDDYNGWTVEDGSWRVTDGVMETYTVSSVVARVWHNSSQVVGTWSFDYFHYSANDDYEVIFLFIANGTEGPANYTGYGVRFCNETIYLVKQFGGFSNITILGSVIAENITDTWTQIDVTRDGTGGMHVYLNANTSIAEPDISFVDTTYSYSERFVVSTVGYYMGIFDNVSVNDQILITPPEPTTTTTTSTTSTEPTTSTTTPTEPEPTGDGLDPLLLALVGGAVVIVIVLVIVWSKRTE